MAQTIKIKRSSTSGNKLTSSNSVAGELGLNTADKALYIQTGSTDASVVTVYDDSILHLDDANNRVGIGTTSPTHHIHITGGITNGAIGFASNSLKLGTYSNIGYNRIYGNGTDLGLAVNNGVIKFDNQGTEFARLTNTGRIGLGETSPNYTIHAKKDMASTPSNIIYLEMSGTNANGGGGALRFDTSASNSDESKFYASIEGIRSNSSDGSNELRFFTAKASTGTPTQKMVIDEDGNVGIATTSPSNPLHVVGAIRSEGATTSKYLQVFGGNSGNFIDSYANDLFLRPNGNTGQALVVRQGGAAEINGTVSSGAITSTSGTSGTSPNTLKIITGTEANTAQGDVYAALEFRVTGAENSTGTLSDSTVGAIKAIDYRSGTTSFEDAGIGFYTLDTDESTHTFRGGFSNAGGFFVSDDGVVDNNTAQGQIYAVGKISSGNDLVFNNQLKHGSTTVVNTDSQLTLNTINVTGADFVVLDNNNTNEANFIWRDRSANRLYLGTTTDVVEFRGNVNFQSGHTLSHNGNVILDASRNLTNIGTVSSGPITAADSLASSTPLTIGSNSQTSFTYQQWKTSAHGAAEAYVIAYGAAHSSQAGNFAMKNLEPNGEIFFELASSVEPLRFASNGAATFNKAFTFPTTDGSANQVLKTDGSGNVTWATEAAVSASTSISDADGDTKIQVEEIADEDIIRFDTAGAQRMIIDETGKVGINSSSLTKTLNVGGTFLATGEVFFSHFDNITSSSRMRDDLRLNFGTARTFAITGNSTNMHMKNGTADVMTFDTSNRVGIGTTSPDTGLDVTTAGVNGLVLNSDTSDTANSARLFFKASGGTVGMLNVNNSLSFRTGMTIDSTSGTERLNINSTHVASNNTVLLKGANDNSGKADFAVDVGSSPQVSLHGSQVQIGSTDMNWNSKFFYDSSGGHIAVWDNNLEFFTQGSNTGSATARDIIFSPQISGTAVATERVRIKGDTGRVGIGTASPNVPLEIHGADIATATTTTSSSVLRLVRDVVDSSFPLRKDSAVDFMLSRQQAVANNFPYTRLDIRLSGGSTDSHSPSLDVMSLLHDGNVGIGTTSPSEKLHVTDTVFIDYPDGSGASLKIGRNDTSNYWEVGHAGGDFRLYNTAGSGSDILFGVQNGGVDQGNKVGIGTASPDKKLTVDGDIKVGNGDAFMSANVAGSTRSLISLGTDNILRIKGNDSEGSSNVISMINGGKVGIGTTAPADRLEIRNNHSQLRLTDSDDNKFVQFSYSGGFLAVRNNNASTSVNLFSLTETGDFSIGTLNPASRLHVKMPNLSGGNNGNGLLIADDGAELKLEIRKGTGGVAANRRISLYEDGGSFPLYLQEEGGNVGIGIAATGTVNAKLQVEELGIDTTTTTTSATTQVAIDTMAAATFRSAKYTIQVTNTTDSTYHVTEILLIHDGTTPGITEYGTVFTGSAAEATFDADILSGNVRLLATPATIDSMTFKVVRHCITV